MRQEFPVLAPRLAVMLLGLAWLGFGSLASAQTILDVTNFGAKGDAVQCYVNTVSNSVIVTSTNQLSAADIGKAIEVFDAGSVTIAPECQDLVATITNVVHGTNIYLSIVARRTLSNTFATYGQDNRESFQNCVDAASGPNTIISIPPGNFLILTRYSASAGGNVGVRLHKGGLQFVGSGTNATVLLSQGAWLRNPNISNLAWRGFLFAIVTPVTNDFPVTIENMTLDGGVPDGLTSDHSFPASNVTGNGWDETHGAVAVRGASWQANTISHMMWRNVWFRHWRGEMAKSNDGSTNGNLNIFNCRFEDGNATAINIYASQNISNCVFARLFQVGEFYQAYNTNTSYLQNSLVTDISANGWAFNGAKSNSAPFIVRSNTWNLVGGFNGIMTQPGVNITISNNHFIGQANTIAIALGANGYQGTWCNSNILIAGNYFLNCAQVVQLSGASTPTEANRIDTAYVLNNTITNGNGVTPTLLVPYGWATRVTVSGNTVGPYSDPQNGERRAHVGSGAYGSQIALVSLDNDYYSPIRSPTGITNYIGYEGGSRYEVISSLHAAAKFALKTTNANQIPVGAQILIRNGNPSNVTIPVYLNSELTRGPVNLKGGDVAIFSWTNGAWQKFSGLIPPGNLHTSPPGP